MRRHASGNPERRKNPPAYGVDGLANCVSVGRTSVKGIVELHTLSRPDSDNR